MKKRNKVTFNWQRFFTIIKKEFIQISRDKFSLRLPIGMPIMMMLLFGYAVNTEVDHISTAVFDQSNTQESREYIQKFSNTGYFVMDYWVTSQQELSDLIDQGKAKAGLVIPVGYAKDIKRNKVSTPQLIIDGSDPTLARTALNSGILISQVYSRKMGQQYLLKKGAIKIQSPGVELNTKVWYNPNMDSNKFSIPGLIGLILQNITVMLTAFAMVREKERGTMEQLMVTPIKPFELILGKLIPYILIGYGGFLFTIILSYYWFHVEIAGSLTLLLLLGAMFVICALAMGMLISTFAKNQTQAMQTTIIIILPSVLLSGFMFPIEAMPFWLRPLSMILPLTYFLRIDRGIILKGIGFGFLWQDALALVLFVLVILAIAIKRFRKSLD